MESLLKSGHKAKKQARWSHANVLLPRNQMKFPLSRLERSALMLHMKERSSRGPCRKPRRRSHHRRSFIESRPRIITGRSIVDEEASQRPSVPHLQVEGSFDHIPKRSKKRRSSSRFLASSGLSSPNLCSFDGGSSQYIDPADAASASTLSFCSRFGAHQVSRSGSTGCVEKPYLDISHGVSDSTSCCPAIDIHTIAVSPSETTVKFLPFGKAESFHGFSAHLCPKFHQQITPICLVLDSSPDAELPRNKKPAERFQDSTEFLSPIIRSYDYSDDYVAVAAASASSTSILSQEDSSFYYKNYEAALSCGPRVNLIPSSPNLMFQQIMRNQDWGFTPLIDSETNCEMFHVGSLDEDSLLNLRERELGLPLLWGYLDRSHFTGIYEPHRYFVVIWHIQHASKYKYQLDTLFRAVNLMDRCLSSGTLINRKILWLLGVACMCVAAKIEETQFSSIISVMQGICTEIGSTACFTSDQLVWMETVVLKIVNFECSTPTAAAFIWHYLKDFRKDREIQMLAMSILCLSLTDYEILRFPASIVAASAVFLTCLILNRDPPLVLIKVVMRSELKLIAGCFNQ